jgi:high-affinity nickel-transport protein
VAFLLGIALFNLSSLCSTYRLLRRLRAGRAIGPELLQEPAVASGLLARVLSPVLRLVARSSHMYPVGFLFGLGFDTATEVAVLGMAATGAASGLDPRAILLFPALFACGMALVDTLDSTLMVAAYGCALARPAAKLRYNMAMTGISIVIAVAVGTVEAAGLLGERLRLAGRLWQWVRVLNDNFAFLGYLIAGIFAVGWVIAALVRELSSARPRSLRRRDSSPMPGKYSHLLPDESFPGGPDRADRVTRLQGIET